VKPGTGSSDKAFSVIIPTFNRAASLRRVLSGLCGQVYPTDLMEVVVISDGSSDGSAQVVRNLHLPLTLKLFEQPHRGPAAARNLGIERARGPFVLFLDDDVIPSPRLVAEHARGHGTMTDLALVGPLLPATTPRSPWSRWEAWTLQRQYTALQAEKWSMTFRQFFTGNASLRLEHLQRAGGFDTRFRRAEDVELGLRLSKLGVRFIFNPAAGVDHIAQRRFGAWLRASYEYGRAETVMRVTTDPLNPWVLTEFQRRHWLTQRLVCWGLRHRRAAQALPAIAFLAAHGASLLQRPRALYAVCSAIFNLTYWRGVSDGLGGTARALELLGAASHSAAGPLARIRSGGN
jgi:GT2 family glycosyltransferase